MKNNGKIYVIRMMLVAVFSIALISCGGGKKKNNSNDKKNKAPLALVYYASSTDHLTLVSSPLWQDGNRDLLFGYYLPKLDVIVALRTGSTKGQTNTGWVALNMLAGTMTLDGKELELPSKDLFSNWGQDEINLLGEQRSFLSDKGMKYALGNYGALWCKEERDTHNAYYFSLKDIKIDYAHKHYPGSQDRVAFAVK